MITTSSSWQRQCLLRWRVNARNVSYTPNLTGEKHNLSTLVDQTHIQLTRRCMQKSFFFKIVFHWQWTVVRYDISYYKWHRPVTLVKLRIHSKNTIVANWQIKHCEKCSFLESCKTEEDKKRENKLLQDMLEVVEKREEFMLETKAATQRWL